jgi:hypothetical protein
MPRPADRRFASVQELLPLEEIVGDVLCLRGGDYRAVLETSSVNFALKSEAEQEALVAGYRTFLNALSYPIQVVVRIVPTDVEAYLAGLRERFAGRGDALRRLALDHEAFVRRLARERTLLERRFYVVIPAGLDGVFERRGVRWPWQRNRERHVRWALEAASTPLALRCQEVVQGLVAFGVAARRLGGDELACLWTEMLSPDSAGTQRVSSSSRSVVTSQRRKAVAVDV